MSYLALPRIVFAGRFRGDVSTINNQAGNYEPDAVLDELWNPEGTGAFGLLDCRVTGAFAAVGAQAPGEPLVGMTVADADRRASAKLVDLDPEWQMASEIWGFEIRLVDPTSGQEGFRGRFAVASFRDLMKRQLFASSPNQQPSGASFVSVLEDVRWGPLTERSEVLRQLREAAAADDRLSVVLNTFGFYYSHVNNRFATGSLVGCIGPWSAGEPQSFVAGRRLEPFRIQSGANPPQPVTLVGAVTVEVAPGQNRITVDLGNSLPIDDTDGTLSDLTKVPFLTGAQLPILAVLPDENVASGAVVDAGRIVEIGLIDLKRPNWYRDTGGVETFTASADAVAAAERQPLALVARLSGGNVLVLNREVQDGLYVRADTFVRRMDPSDSSTVEFHARRYGRPASGVKIHVEAARDGTAPTEPLQFDRTLTSDARGGASLSLRAQDPGNPRGSIDGAVISLQYAPRLDAQGRPDYAGSGLSPLLDRVVVHVRDSFDASDPPEWHRDIAPILSQYARLYPVMGRQLFDLGDYEAVVRHRAILSHAFEIDIENPNHMPVTRDMSRAKRAAILRWLAAETGNPQEPLPKGMAPNGPRSHAGAPSSLHGPARGEPAYKRPLQDPISAAELRLPDPGKAGTGTPRGEDDAQG